MAGNIVATTWVEVVPEIKGSRAKMSEAIGNNMEPAAEDAGKASGEKASSSFGSSLKKGLAGAAAIGTALYASMKSLSDQALETTSEMGKLDTAFQTSGHSAETARGVYDGFVGILGDIPQAVEASNHLAKLTSSTEELSQWTDIAAGVYATFGDSLPLEGLTEAANETAKVGQVTGPFADALNWASMSTEQWSAALSGNSAAQSAFMSALNQGASAEDAFNAALSACNTEAERASLVTEVMSATYGEAGAQYQETNADVIAAQKAQSDFNIAMGEAGRAVMPYVTCLTQIASAVVSVGAQALPGLVSGLQTAAQVAGPFGVAVGIAAAAVAVLSGSLTASSAASFVSGMLQGTKAMRLYTTATNLAKAAQQAFNLALKANPLGLVVTLIAAVAAALAVFFTQTEAGRQIWQSFMAWLQTAWTNVQTFFQGLWTSITSAFTSAGTAAQTAWAAVTSFFSGIPASIQAAFAAIGAWLSAQFANAGAAVRSTWSAVTSFLSSVPGRIRGFFASIGNWLKSQFDNAANGVNNAWNGVLSFFSGIPGKIKGFFSGAGDWLVNAGKSAIDGFFNGLKSAWNGVTGWLSSRASEIISLKGPPEYDRVMLVENGELTMEGYGAGLVGGFERVKRQISTINSEVESTFEADASGAAVSFTADDVSADGEATGREVVKLLRMIYRAIPEGMTESEFARKAREAVRYAQ